MNDVTDKIGVVRDHRWMRAPEQIALLRERCPKVLTLGGGGILVATREDLVRFARPGTVFEFVHAFLLADPKRKRSKGGMKEDFRVALAMLEKRGAYVADVDGGVCSGKQRKALLALVDSDLARHNRGARSATNGTRSKGRQEADFTVEQKKEAKSIWHNPIDFKTWKAAGEALAEIVSPNGQKFTVDRANKLWPGGRK